MITADGWLDFATRIPGPATKVNGWSNTSRLYIPHSAVGNNLQGWLTRLQDPNDPASVTGWINKDGTVIQHYPMAAQCWASGSGFPNNNGNAFENQGGAPGNESEPLTEGQIAANVRIIRELGEWKGRPSVYWKRPSSSADLQATLYEHRECTRFGSLPTACPSGRIPWQEFLRRIILTPIIEEDASMSLHVTISAAERGSAGFRSYVISASGAGFRAAHVPDAETFEVIEELGLCDRTLFEIPLAQLRAFHPVPDPLDP